MPSWQNSLPEKFLSSKTDLDRVDIDLFSEWSSARFDRFDFEVLEGALSRDLCRGSLVECALSRGFVEGALSRELCKGRFVEGAFPRELSRGCFVGGFVERGSFVEGA